MSEPWIAPKLTGGIGNRFFQMMAAIGIAERSGYNPVILLQRMMPSDHGNYKLLFEFFPTIPVIQSADSWNEIKENDKTQILDSETFLTKRIVVNGYFQNTQNFPTHISKYLPVLPKYVRNPRRSVAIHFRFGDYRILSHHQIPLGSYYAHCICQYPKDTQEKTNIK